MSSKCYRKRSQKGGAAKEVAGFNSIPYAAAAISGPNSQAAMMAKIPRTITEQGMNFQKLTSTYHRTRKALRGRKQRGGAAPVENTGAVLPSSMTGPMTTASSGILGGSATGRLDTMLSQTASLVKQVGGGSRKRKQQQKQRKQQKTRKQQRKQQKQRGGSHQPLGFGPAAPTSGDYTILSAQELKAAGLNPQWFDENQVNPSFGGAITVPGGKLN
jgi:hypothetical protein